jgi:subtilisin-like proprotein convertase family protein
MYGGCNLRTVGFGTVKEHIMMRALPGLTLLLLGSAGIVRAQGGPLAAALPNYDVRASKAVDRLRASSGSATATRAQRTAATMAAARARLATRQAGTQVEPDPVVGGPSVVRRKGGFLTAAAPGAAAEQVVRSFLAQEPGLFGLSAADAAALRTTASYANPAGNLRWVTLEQAVAGVPVFRGELRAAVTADGRLAALTSELMPGKFVPPAAAIGAAAAVERAAAAIGVGLEAGLAPLDASTDGRRAVFARGPFSADVVAEQMVFPLGPDDGRRAWRVVLMQPGPSYLLLIDAVSGDLLFRKNLTQDQTQTATFEVYPSDSPGPLSPTTATPGSGIQGPAASRGTFTFVSELAAFDNLGWITDGASTTTGNNVDGGLDLVFPDGIDAGGRATGGCVGPSPACRNFAFTYAPPPGGADPPTGAAFRNGAVTDLFFWSNRYHDRLYGYGFTEPARNFQTDNFGRGGAGGDAVSAQAQDSSGTDNANFSTPPDGSPGVMQMYIFTFPSPNRDGTLDHEIVIHELTHGLSNRLIGDGSGLDNLQGGGMGEGWSDFYAISLLSEPADDPDTAYAAGGYATLDFGPLGTDNYFYGIRRFPYSTDPTINPLTWADTDPTQIDTTDGLYPESPLDQSSNGADEVHNVGEIWANTLWGARSRIIARLGAVAGNDRILQVVTDGMKLTPVDPTFTAARDAIIAADCAGFAGADELDLRAAFAERGLGSAAVAPAADSFSLTGLTESFDMPLVLRAAQIDDSAGNGDGAIEPGEQIGLVVPVENGFDCAPITGVGATIVANTPGVTVQQASSTYGAISAGSSAAGTAFQFTVAANVPCATRLDFTVTIIADGGLQIVRPLRLAVGTPAGSIFYTYSGPAVFIPDNDPVGASVFLNVPATSAVGHVRLTIQSLTHTFVSDLRVELIAPDATSAIVMEGDGGSTDDILDTSFDDDAATPIQGQPGPIHGGTFRPATPFGVFTGASAQGQWVLHVVDQVGADFGSINSWKLTLNPLVCEASMSVPIAAKQLFIKDRATDATKRLLKFVTTAAVDTGMIDPVSSGAAIQVFDTAGGPDAACLVMPAGAGWTAKGGGDFVYKDKTLAAGPVKSAVIKNGRTIKVVAKGNGPTPIPYTLDEVAQTAVGVEFHSGPLSVCTEFGGLTRIDSGTNPPNPGGRGRFLAKDAPAPGACPTPPGSCP